MEAYPSNIHKAFTLMNEYNLLKLDVSPMPAQGTAFVTTSCIGKRKESGWKAISPEAQTKVINDHQKAADDEEDDKSSARTESAKTRSPGKEQPQVEEI